ncbi:protein NLP9 [Forsythia ovata]|uniref:Protein NLP9 n=1 Tax=Forsythia ovata TaxID=205694 RepID=A0ABD1V091_9LAMI
MVSLAIYNVKGDVEITEEKIKEGKEKAVVMFQAVEALISRPILMPTTSVVKHEREILKKLMNFDAYARWCNNPGNAGDQMFPRFAMSLMCSTSTNFSPFDGLNVTENYNSGVPMAKGDMIGTSLSDGTKMMF